MCKSDLENNTLKLVTEEIDFVQTYFNYTGQCSYILNHYFIENKMKIRKQKLNENNQKRYNERAQNKQILIKVSELNLIADGTVATKFDTFDTAD